MLQDKLDSRAAFVSLYNAGIVSKSFDCWWSCCWAKAAARAGNAVFWQLLLLVLLLEL
jgi:hypothetical protein